MTCVLIQAFVSRCNALRASSASCDSDRVSRQFHKRSMMAAGDNTDSDNDMSRLGLFTSRHGLDPRKNRFHAPMVYHERYSCPWPENHTFPMTKFKNIAHFLLTDSMHNNPRSRLPRPLVRNENDFFRPLDLHDVPISWLSGPIDRDFVDRFLAGKLSVEEARYIGFREETHRPELIERTVLEVAGTVLTAQLASHFGVAVNLAGGTHHATMSGGAGYTILNDLAVSANFLTDPNLHMGSIQKASRVLVIDCDVHQGDGTAKFSGGPLSERLFTLSLHCASNYPRYKANSTFDVGLEDGLKDEDYLSILSDAVEEAFLSVKPDFVLYDAGVDIYENDRLGRLNISEEGIRLRDRYVLEFCITRGVPVAAVIGGGYDKDVNALGARHSILHQEASYLWRKYRMWKSFDSVDAVNNGKLRSFCVISLYENMCK